jgi:hypothetical protein
MSYSGHFHAFCHRDGVFEIITQLIIILEQNNDATKINELRSRPPVLPPILPLTALGIVLPIRVPRQLFSTYEVLRAIAQRPMRTRLKDCGVTQNKDMFIHPDDIEEYLG